MSAASESSDAPRMRGVRHQQRRRARGAGAYSDHEPSAQISMQGYADWRQLADRLRRSARIGVAQRDTSYLASQFVLDYQEMVYNLAYRLLGDTELAASATRDALLNAFRVLPERRARSPELWIMRLVVTACQDQLRLLLECGYDARNPLLDENRQRGCAAYLDHQLAPDDAQSLLNTLPHDQRVALVLADVQGLTYRDIAEVTGLPAEEVCPLLSRGRAALRDALLARAELSPEAQR